MHRIASALIPILLAVAASVWLYGWPGPRQRLEAPRGRQRVVLGIALSALAASPLVFVTRDYWGEARMAGDEPLSLFFGLILVFVALLYAVLPPQRDL